jgi:hypothetical protein
MSAHPQLAWQCGRDLAERYPQQRRHVRRTDTHIQASLPVPQTAEEHQPERAAFPCGQPGRTHAASAVPGVAHRETGRPCRRAASQFHAPPVGSDRQPTPRVQATDCGGRLQAFRDDNVADDLLGHLSVGERKQSLPVQVGGVAVVDVLVSVTGCSRRDKARADIWLLASEHERSLACGRQARNSERHDNQGPERR